MDEKRGTITGPTITIETGTPSSQGAQEFIDQLTQDVEKQDLIITVYVEDVTPLEEKMTICALSSVGEERFEPVLDDIRMLANRCGAHHVSASNVFDPHSIEAPIIKNALPKLVKAIDKRPTIPDKPHPYGAEVVAKFRK